MSSLEEVFAPGGLLAAAIAGYRRRADQVEMAQAIGEAIESTGVLVAEAGTGTGKTFAYLVPALLAGGKVIVSTGTKTLQDQLYDRDLPAVRAALASGASAALLKGRANYVCLYRLRRAVAEGRATSSEEAVELRRIERFAATSVTGDRADLGDVPEDAPIWAQATSTRDNCLGQGCPDYADCFVMRARRNALAADVVVINHHLFFADVVLRDEGVAELLPACNTLVFDEAHQLPETARLFFGDSLSTSQLLELSRDARGELRVAGGGSPELEALCNRLERAARDLRLALGEAPLRLAWPQALRVAGFPEALIKIRAALKMLDAALAAQAERSEGLGACSRRAGNAHAVLCRLLESDGSEDVRWAEALGQSVQLHVTPLHSGELFRRQMDDHPRAWIFTSATLAVGADFGHFTRELGVPEATTRRWESPFRFAEQALVYLPSGLPPDPNDPAFTDAVIEAAFPVLQASGGRAFLLFTTLRALRRAHELLRRGTLESAARARHRVAQRAAGALSQAGQRRAAWQRVFLGRGGRARRCALARGDRQAALRAARRSSARGAHRCAEERRPQSLQRAAAAAGGAAAKARSGAVDSGRRRSRRAHALRSALAVAALRQTDPREPAADEAYAQPRGGARVLR